jgi:hypothetical protein
VPTTAFIYGSSDATSLLFWCAVGFFAGIGLFFYGFRLLQRRRLILDTPFSKIRSASIGMVEISGLATGPYTMIAPITTRPCFYYRTLVWEWKQSGKNKEWVKIAGECMHVPFFVDDNTGRLLIDPRGADIDLHRDFQEEFNGSFFSSCDDAPGNVNQFLARHGISTTNKIKVEEFCIKPKNSLFILGTLTDNPGLEVSPHPIRDDAAVSSFSSRGFSISLTTMSFPSKVNGDDFQIRPFNQDFASAPDHGSQSVIRLSPLSAGSVKTSDMSQQQKIAAALLQAGISSPAAWSAAGVSPVAGAPTGIQVLSDPSAADNGNAAPGSASTSGFDPHPRVVLMKGPVNKTFLISWRSQQELAHSLGWKCALMIWGGPALALLSLYIFLSIKNLL